MNTKKKFTLEFTVKSTPHILYEFISEPSEMAEWFADEVQSHGTHFTFVWDGSAQDAEMIDYAENEFARFRWQDAPKGEYFEFRIDESEVTGDTVLYITDFAEESERKESEALWESQIHTLKKRIGGDA